MQITDDPELLELMLSDLESADPLYRPGNYWEIKTGPLVEDLRSHGLRDIRRRRTPVLQSFGVGELGPGTQEPTPLDRTVRRVAAGLERRGRRLAGRLPGGLGARFARPARASSPHYGVTPERLRRLAVEHVRLRAEGTRARPLAELDISLAGNPEDVFEGDGRPVTMSVLHYYLRYVYCCRHVDFRDVGVVVELGCGSGRQAEILKKLHPHLTVLLFDLVPQLYIAEQLLSAAFPGEVVSYRRTRDFQDLHRDVVPGRIHLLPAWRFPLLGGWSWDLFWNAASFQEMEPGLVRNYLGYVNAGARLVYLQELFSGKPPARRAGAPGVLQPVTLRDYEGGLPRFQRRDLSPSWMPLGPQEEEGPYHDSWWSLQAR
ncbi:MAG: putative sugar O-methyltransferase [Deltaproteobacteria bacterium]|nr:putative sugar O-methyltransferase [Deltaproteobacteria bacterium]